ncbi:redoxin domain-containing protein [Actinokineospora sp.]|uniref:redoxin domain-containing protein n=1 Tax=Actinokineospora sp. TaxID=1872133 RepID=UPI004037D12F
MGRTGLAMAMGVLAVLVGCGAPDAARPAASGAAIAPAASAPAPVSVPGAPVPEMLRFSSTTLDGAAFKGESLAGKPALLWFWAPWCTKCQREAPTILEAAKSTAGKVNFVGIAAQDQVAAMRKFVEQRGVGSFTHLADTDAALWRRFGVTVQPAYAFVRADGSVEVSPQLGKDEFLAKVAGLAG